MFRSRSVLAAIVLGFLNLTLAAPPHDTSWAPGAFGSKRAPQSRTSGEPQACTYETQQVRKNFDKLQPDDRKAYTDAVQCLMSQPSKLDPTAYPAAINKFFDYAVIHTNRTPVVHLDGYFFVWHRMFLWLYEQDLKTTCGYNGTQPYWNWPETADNLYASPTFDGSEWSMSGDGEFNNTGLVVLSPTFNFTAGQGGGCVKSGPFANLTTTMAPIPVTRLLTGSGVPAGAFDLNEKCLTRDLNPYVAQRWTNLTAYAQALGASDVGTFESLINGSPATGELGLHSGAHFAIGEPASSLFVSPMDPIWYNLHAFLDLTFTAWQELHPDVATDIVGTMTALNTPPSANVTLHDTTPDFGYLLGGLTVSDLMSTTAGPFCYRYE